MKKVNLWFPMIPVEWGVLQVNRRADAVPSRSLLVKLQNQTRVCFK